MKPPLTHLVGSLVFCVIVFAGFYAWYMSIVDMSASVAKIQDQIDAKTATASRVASVQAALAEIADSEASVQSYFVPEDGIVPFIDSLGAYGKSQKTHVNILSVSSGSVGTHSVFTLALAIEGPFDATMRTIGLIEYAPYDLTISGLSLEQVDKNSWHANLTMLVGSASSSPSTTGMYSNASDTPASLMNSTTARPKVPQLR